MTHLGVRSSAFPLGMRSGGTGVIQPLVIEQDCEQAVTWLARRLTAAGLRVASSDFLRSRRCLECADLGGLRAVPSFDLHAVLSQPCPRHRNEVCTCQVAVVSVHDPSGAWVALMARGHDGRTWVNFVDAATHPPLAGLGSTVHRAIAGLPP